MANFMARYRGGDGHYADVECAYAELERYLVLSCNEQAHYWKEKGRSKLNSSLRRTPAFSPSRFAIRACSRSSGARLAKAASFRARPGALSLWTHRPVDPIGSLTAIPQSG